MASRSSQLPDTIALKTGLAICTVAYGLLGVTAAALFGLGNKRTKVFSWPESKASLTTILAIFGVLFTVLSRLLLAQCQQASLQYLGNKSLNSDVKIETLRKCDIATRGGIMNNLKYNGGWKGYLYRFGLPILAIVMSAVFKKAFVPEDIYVSTTISGDPAFAIDPIDIGSHIRGTEVPGAVLYNSTADIGTEDDLSQTSWTYMAADRADSTGLAVVLYSMPGMPRLILRGTPGYSSYTTNRTTGLSSELQCTAEPYIIYTVEGLGIQNDNYNISTGYLSNGTAILQVTTPTTQWSCIAILRTTVSSTATFISDASGNWVTYRVMGAPGGVKKFTTTPARWTMIADIMSDALLSTASYADWDWNTDDIKSPSYPRMLISTRIGFAASTLSYSSLRMGAPPDAMRGNAQKLVPSVRLLTNWALISTAILLLLQAIIAGVHLAFPLGNISIEFSLFQVMAMSAKPSESQPIPAPVVGAPEPVLLNDPPAALVHHNQQEENGQANDHGPVNNRAALGDELVGYCSGVEPPVKSNRKISIRKRRIFNPQVPENDGREYHHLEIVVTPEDGIVPLEWQVLTPLLSVA